MDDESTDDEIGSEIEIVLRSPREVAARLLVLGTVCRRAFLEARPHEVADDDPEAERFDLSAWLREEGVDRAVTPWERRVLQTRIGRLPAEDAAVASWQAEALIALGWSLSLVESMPPYDAAADPAALLGLLPAPWATSAAFSRSALLRPEAEIARERERAELWLWRADVADLLAAEGGLDRDELTAAIRDVAADVRNVGLLTELRRGDFPARGGPYRDLDPVSLAEVAAIAAIRSRTLDWLCGLEPSWGEPSAGK